MTPILWWSALTACVLPPVLSGAVAILGSRILSSHHCSITRWSLERVCARVCLCACVSGEPLGARQGSHCQWQPWGRVWPSRTRVLGHSQTSWWLPSVYPVLLAHMSLPSTLVDADLPLTPPSLEVLSCLFGFIACPPFFFFWQFVYLPPSHVVSPCRRLPLSFSPYIQYFGEVVFLH